MGWSSRILSFLSRLSIEENLREVEVLYPFDDSDVWEVLTAFYEKYYEDERERKIILGINPGRFGAGVTGVPFTDPVRLYEKCGISNSFQKRQELSSVWVYQLIEEYGGVGNFYSDFYISAVSPLGFIKEGKNYNYYDDQKTLKRLKPFIIQSLEEQLEWPVNREKAYIWGKGKNYHFISKLNKERGYFKELVPLPHPRWIMQYRSQQKDAFIRSGLDKLKN